MRVEVRYEIDTDMAFHEVRALLSDAMLLDNLEQIVERVREQLGGIVCKVHNQPPYVTVSVLSPSDLVVELSGCCDQLVRTARAAFDRGLVQTAYFQPGMKLLIQVTGDPEPLVFDFFQIDTLVIGRSSAESEEVPDIDLAAFGAFERGISRRHAALFWRNGTLHIADEGSANGTFLNGKRLAPHRPAILRNNDRITLGGLDLSLNIEY